MQVYKLKKAWEEARATGEYYAWLNRVVIYHFQLIGAIWDADCVIRFLLFKDARNLKFLWKISDFFSIANYFKYFIRITLHELQYTGFCKFDRRLPIHRPRFWKFWPGLLPSCYRWENWTCVSYWRIQKGLTQRVGGKGVLGISASWITLAKAVLQWKSYPKAQRNGMLVLNDNG